MSVVVDGAVLEGGGQILRNSVSLAALLSKSITIHSIRNGRKPPGLKNQHKTGLELTAQISSAQLTGASIGSSEISFRPQKISLPGVFSADAITAGSTTLLLQISFPLLLFSAQKSAASTLILKGGTNATQAPQVDYTQHVLLPFVAKHFGIKAELGIKKRGYFPKGGGEIVLNVTATDECLSSFTLLERGQVKKIGGIAHLAGLPSTLGEEMVEGATRKLRAAGFTEDRYLVDIVSKREKNENTFGNGSGIVLWAELEGGGFIGGSAVGRKGIDAFKTGEEAAKSLLNGLDAGGCVDEWLQDQIIIFMALAGGHSQVRCGKSPLTLHTRTAIWVAEQLTSAKFETEQEASGHTIIRCNGIGFTAKEE